MGKQKKESTPVYWEGCEAALTARARNTNPYPYSVPADRYEWFKGYDETTDELSRDKANRR